MPTKQLCSHGTCFNVNIDEGHEVPGFCEGCEEWFCENHIAVTYNPHFEAEEALCVTCSGASLERSGEA